MTYITFFEEHTTTREQIIATMRLEKVCDLHECTMWIDGRQARHQNLYNLEDGSFVQLRIRQEEPIPQEDSMDVDDDHYKDDTAGSSQEARAKKPRLHEVQRGDPRSTAVNASGSGTRRSCSPPPGGDMVLGFIFFMILKAGATVNQSKIGRLPQTTTRKESGNVESKKVRNYNWKMFVGLCFILPITSGLQIQQWQAAGRLGEASNPGP